MGEQIRHDLGQRGATGKRDVGGHLNLVGDPVVAAEPSPGDHGQDRAQRGHHRGEQPRPTSPPQPLGDGLRLAPVVDVKEGVGVATVADPGPIQRSGQHLPPVDPHLHREREPRLQPYVHQPQTRVQDIEIEVQALTAAAAHRQPARLDVSADVKRTARLHRRQHAHQPGGDAPLGGYLAGQVLLRPARRLGVCLPQIPVRRAGRLRHRLNVRLQLIGDRLDIAAVVLEQHPLTVQERLHPQRPDQPHQMPLEDHPVVEGQLAQHLAAVHHL